MLGRGLERQGLEEEEVPPGVMGGLHPAPSADTNVFNLTSILLSDYSPIRLLSRGPASLEPTANGDSVWTGLLRSGSWHGLAPLVESILHLLLHTSLTSPIRSHQSTLGAFPALLPGSLGWSLLFP